MKLSFKVPLMYVANEKTLWANVFKTITANAHEIPTKTLDKKMNCFGVITDCDKAIILSSLRKSLFIIIFFKISGEVQI